MSYDIEVLTNFDDFYVKDLYTDSISTEFNYGNDNIYIDMDDLILNRLYRKNKESKSTKFTEKSKIKKLALLEPNLTVIESNDQISLETLTKEYFLNISKEKTKQFQRNFKKNK